MTIKVLKDLTSLSLNELIENLKVYEMIIKKDSEIVKDKGEIKSLALKAKKESSDKKSLSFKSEDEEYAMAVRDFKKLFKRRESLNVTFVETPPPSKTSPLVDDDLDEEEELVPHRKSTISIGTKWAYENKLDEKDIVEIRLDFKLFQMDIKSAFPNGFINEEVYMPQPSGFIDFKKPNHVYKLKKALYGPKKAPKAWLDVMFCICLCACFQEDPKTSHLEVVKRIFKYVEGTMHLGLWYPKGIDTETVVYFDSDHAGDYVDRKSTSGICTFVGSCLTSWLSKKQTTLAISMIEVEYTYIKSKDIDLWQVIQNGNFVFEMEDPETNMIKETPYELLKDDDKKQLGKNNESKMTLYNTLPRKEYERVFMSKIAKEFSISNEETINSGFNRFNAIVTSCKSLDQDYYSKNYVRKFLHDLLLKWKANVTTIEEAQDLAILPFGELISNFKDCEMILENDGVASKTTREMVKPLIHKSKVTRDQTSEDSDSQGGSNEYVDEAEAFKLMARNFRMFFPKGHFISKCPNPRKTRLLPKELRVIVKMEMNLQMTHLVSWRLNLRRVSRDDEAPIEDQPLPADASPTTLSPSYVTDFDPEEDPEEDPANYPDDREYDEEEKSFEDDANDEDEEEAFEDEDKEEEEEHLAPADSTTLLIPSPPLPVPSSPLPLPSLPTHTSATYAEAPLGYKAAMIQWSTTSPSTHHSSEIPSPPLLLPSTTHRDDLPEADMPL
uniref:Retrovirus-related Pol polyprotein from transposon TNT 1-94 n=1 Tax=Tanacetum cinerariifolium TaxID=118510 RepID=A0A6L2L178_TANCI|nr:retrovirus-related Pol polyprotein from transposon TNT 1-94 [Tanacetum cinerariifolium]